jgi:hypothetical protein
MKAVAMYTHELVEERDFLYPKRCEEKSKPWIFNPIIPTHIYCQYFITSYKIRGRCIFIISLKP